jgi:hypothetical protein
MENKIILVIPFLLLLNFVLYSQNYVPNSESLNSIRENLEFLASDELEGREATTHGEDLAAEFLSNKLIEYGIPPFGEDGTFFQNFDVDVKKVDSLSSIEFISVDNSISSIELGEDFYISTAIIPSNEFNNLESEIVFGRFGITAPEYEYNDYNGLNVEGKVVLLYSDAPKQDDERLFSDEDHKKFTDPKYKIRNAAERGAKGVLVIPSGFAVKYWKWIKRRALSSTFTLTNNQDGYDESIPSILLSVESISTLLDKERYSYKELIEALEYEEIPEWFLLNKKVKFSYNVYKETKSSKNLIGIIEGTDSELKNEFITIGAHYDHEGIINGVVYNGADDNASGTVAILEAARRLVDLNNNKRSILIIFHAAEEKGLLGSKYLTSNSDFMENVIVNINADMVGRKHVDSIYSIGSDKLSSELKNIVEDVNEETVNFVFNYRFDEPNDPQRLYYRSDHYNYAKQNIPVVFFYDYMLEDYSKPTDTPDKINYEKVEKISTLVTHLALKISNLDHRLRVDVKEEIEEIR